MPAAAAAVGLTAALSGCPAADDGDNTTVASSAEPAYGVPATESFDGGDADPTLGDDATAGGDATAGSSGDATDDTATATAGDSATEGMMCADFDALCFDDMAGEGERFEVECCEPTAMCDIACTNGIPSHCTGYCQPGPGG